MDAKKVKGIFVGYEESKRGYLCFVNGRVVVSRDCTFHELQFTAAAALQEELTRDAEAAEDRVALQEEKYANDAAGPAEPSRRAARIAAHRLYQPWSVESEEEQLRRTLRASAAEEKIRQERIAQEEQNAKVRAAMEAAERAVDQVEEEQKEKQAEPLAVEEEKKQEEIVEAQEEPVVAAPIKKKSRSKKKKISADPPSIPEPRRGVRERPSARLNISSGIPP
jgi:hypothetical protein